MNCEEVEDWQCLTHDNRKEVCDRIAALEKVFVAAKAVDRWGESSGMGNTWPWRPLADAIDSYEDFALMDYYFRQKASKRGGRK